MGPTQILCFWEAVEKSSACFLSFQAGPSCFTPLLSEGSPGGVFHDLEALKPAPNSGVTPLYYYYQNFLIWILNYWLLDSTWKHLQTRGLKKKPSWTQAPLPPPQHTGSEIGVHESEAKEWGKVVGAYMLGSSQGPQRQRKLLLNERKISISFQPLMYHITLISFSVQLQYLNPNNS